MPENEIVKVESAIPQVFNDAQRRLIENETPKTAVFQRQGRGNKTFTYVKGGYVIQQLNQICGHKWDFDILDQTPVEFSINKDVMEVTVRGKLTVHSPNGEKVSKMDFGCHQLECKKNSTELVSYGEALKAAATDCLKRCARQFGIALDVYAPETGRLQDGNTDGNITQPQMARLHALGAEVNASHEEVRELLDLCGLLEKIDGKPSLKTLKAADFQKAQSYLGELANADAYMDIIASHDVRVVFDKAGYPKAKALAIYRACTEQGFDDGKIIALVEKDIAEKETKNEL